MKRRRPSLARSDFTGRVSLLFASFSAVALVLMMGVTFVSVLMRYLFNAPILGSNEIIQLLSVCLVMFAMSYATQTEAHVRVDVLDRAIGRIGRFVGDILARAVIGIILWVLVGKAWDKCLDALEYGDATNMLRIPLWPFYALIAVGMALYLLVVVLQVIDIVLGSPSDD